VGIEADLVNNIDFGRAEQILANKSSNPLTELLLRLTNEIIEDLRLELNKSRASGNLQQSIIPEPVSYNRIEVTAPFYWKYINYGVNGIRDKRGAPYHGKAPSTEISFYDAIYKWIGDKGIVPREERITREKLAGMIVNSVRMKGIEATHFYDKVVTKERKKEMAISISNVIEKAIKVSIKKPI
jgi:hypothetical protein